MQLSAKLSCGLLFQLRRCGKDGAADYKGSPCFQRKQAANCTLPVSNTTSLPVSCCKNTTIPQCNHGTTPGKPADGTLVYLRVRIIYILCLCVKIYGAVFMTYPKSIQI